MIKACRKGSFIHERTIPISLIDTSQIPPVETNVDDVTKLVLFHLQVIQSNIQLIDTSVTKLSSHARRDEGDEDEDIEDNQEDDDSTEPQKKNPKTGSHVNQSRRGGRSGGGRKGGSGKQGRGYANLQLQSSNSLLTLENVYKFKLSQPIFV
jgi:hypothetical protein